MTTFAPVTGSTTVTGGAVRWAGGAIAAACVDAYSALGTGALLLESSGATSCKLLEAEKESLPTAPPSYSSRDVSSAMHANLAVELVEHTQPNRRKFFHA